MTQLNTTARCSGTSALALAAKKKIHGSLSDMMQSLELKIVFSTPPAKMQVGKSVKEEPPKVALKLGPWKLIMLQGISLLAGCSHTIPAD